MGIRTQGEFFWHQLNVSSYGTKRGRDISPYCYPNLTLKLEFIYFSLYYSVIKKSIITLLSHLRFLDHHHLLYPDHSTLHLGITLQIKTSRHFVS